MATGDIGAVIDTLEFDSVYAYQPYLFEVSSGIVGCAYKGPDGDGWLCTFAVDAVGQIGAAPIDTLEFDGSDCTGHPKVLKITGTTKYIIMYPTTGIVEKICTVDIDDSGNIGAAIIDSHTYDATRGAPGDIIYISG